MIRSFEIKDFPTLHRNRFNGLFLDTVTALTRSITMVPAGALLATLAPATGIFTYVATNENNPASRVVGQFMHVQGEPNARLIFITPEESIESPEAPALLDHLATRAGERGAHQMLAEVDERSIAYEILRRSGYVIYTRQRIWSLTPGRSDGDPPWRTVAEKDIPEVYHLYHDLVPAMVQQTETLPWDNLNGLVFLQEGEILAYVHLDYGPKGILAQPFVHPETEQVEHLLVSLYNAVPGKRGKEVYLGVRSHQAWLAPFLEELGYNSAPRQAVMVKRMALTKKVKLPLRVPEGLKNIQPEITSFHRELPENAVRVFPKEEAGSCSTAYGHTLDRIPS
jgi:hypothetical protein